MNKPTVSCAEAGRTELGDENEREIEKTDDKEKVIHTVSGQTATQCRNADRQWMV